MATDPGRVRLPLQIGLASLAQSVRFAAFIWLGPLLLLVAAAPPAGVLGFLWIMVLGLAGVIALVFAIDAADTAKRDRPSDLLLDATGLVVEGDVRQRVRLVWSALDVASCDVVEGEARTAIRWLLLSWLTLRKVGWIAKRVRAPVYQLVVNRRTRESVTLAEGEGEDERLSLVALRDSIRAVSAPDDAAKSGSAAPLPQEILLCPGCGAPQVPADRERIACPFCGHDVEVPDALRERQRALAETRDDSAERLVRRLVDQPGAQAANAWLTWGRRGLVWIQPTLLVFGIVLVYHQTNGLAASVGSLSVSRVAPGDDPVFFYDLALIALAIAVAFGVVWSTLGAFLANRRALRVLAESFGAVPPVKPGTPSACRRCGAPLPSGDGLLARCAYCNAVNVLGVDPRPAAARRRDEARDLASAFAARRHARWRLALTLPACSALALGMAHELVVAWYVPPKGDATYCWPPCGTLVNGDAVRRRVAFSADGATLRATVPAHGTLAWQCYDCSVAVGATHASTQALGNPPSARIVGGALVR